MSRPRDRRDQPSLDRAALKLAGEGWQVFPLHTVDDEGRCSCGRPTCTGNNRGKHPRVLKWQQVATDDVEQIAEWWTRWPDSNIGVLAGDPHEGGSGVWTLDFDADPQKGVDGMAIRAELEAQHGPLGGRELRTGRGVQHVYEWNNQCPDRPATGIAPGVDIRSSGSYFIAPPSRHFTGKTYEWGDGEPHAPPSWILDWIRAQGTQGTTEKLSSDASASSETERLSVSGAGATDSHRELPGPPSEVARVKSALKFSPGAKHADWRNVMFALRSTGWSNAYGLLDEWSKKHTNYDPAENRRQWEAAKDVRDEGKSICLGTLFHIARGHGWKDEWPDPIPLGPRRANIQIDTNELFPSSLSWLATFVEGLAQSLQVPAEFVLLPVMASASAAVSSHFEVHVSNEEWVEPLMLWTLIVSASGSRKTPIEKQILSPFRRWEEDPDFKERLADHRAAVATAKAILKKLERALKPDDAGKAEEHTKKARELHLLVATKPIKNAVLVRDITPQRLCEFLVEHDGRCLISDSEGDLLAKMVEGHTGQQISLGDWLQCYDGNGLKQHRLSGDRLAEKADVAVSLFTQPEELGRTIDDRAANGRGLFARLLILCVPAFRDEGFLLGRKLSPAVRKTWEDRVLELMGRPIPHEKEVIALDPEAHSAFKQWGQEYVERLNALIDIEGDRDDRDPWQRKSAGRILRIAGVFAALNGDRSISKEVMAAAIKWADPLESSFFAAMGRIRVPDAHQKAQRVLAHLHRRGYAGKTIEFREILRNLKGGKSEFRRLSDLHEPLHELTELGWVRGHGTHERCPGGRRVYQEYEVHPELELHCTEGPGDEGDAE